jgi:hypothetical protein
MEVTSTRSLARRAQFARLLRPLKRVGAHVPFYELPCHRVPTLWTLYRGLLRAAPTEQVGSTLLSGCVYVKLAHIKGQVEDQNVVQDQSTLDESHGG